MSVEKSERYDWYEMIRLEPTVFRTVNDTSVIFILFKPITLTSGLNSPSNCTLAIHSPCCYCSVSYPGCWSANCASIGINIKFTILKVILKCCGTLLRPLKYKTNTENEKFGCCLELSTKILDT